MSEFPENDNVFYDVDTFMRSMGQKCRGTPMREDGSDRTEQDDAMSRLYCDLVAEEYKELVDSVSLAESVDAICDLIWVLCGLAFSYGVRPSILQECWNEVYRSNMDKLNGPVAENGKRLKPDGWRGPQIAGILEYHRKNAE